MKRIVVGPCVLMVFGLSSVLGAQEDNQATQTDTEKAFQEYADFLARGVWKATVKRGQVVDGKWQPTGETEEQVMEYRRVGGKKFLQRIDVVNGEPRDRMLIVGVDSETDKVTWWLFGPSGATSGVSNKRDGAWIIEGSFTDEQGQKVEWKRIRTLGDDESRVETVAKVNGVEVPQAAMAPPVIWKRHSK